MKELKELARSAPVVVLSFVDCPWCLAAKTLLLDELELPPDSVRVVELEVADQRALTITQTLTTNPPSPSPSP